MILIDSTQHLKGPNQQPLTTHGHTNLRLVVGGLIMPVKAILADITQHFILGAQFLSETRAKISFIENTVTFYEDLTVPILRMELPEIKYSPNCKVLSAVERIAVPPQSLIWIPISFSPTPKTDIVTVTQIARPKEHQILTTRSKIMRFINETDELVWITNHQTLGWYDIDTNHVIQYPDQLNSIKLDNEQSLPLNPIMDLELTDEDRVKRWNLLQKTLQSTPFQINTDQTKTFFQHLEKLQFVLALDDEPLGLHEYVGEVIKTNCAPIRHRPRPLPPPKQIILDGIIEDFKRRGILVDSDSAWCSPVQIVEKKDKKSSRL